MSDLHDLWAAARTFIQTKFETLILVPSPNEQEAVIPDSLSCGSAACVWYGITGYNPMGQQAPEEQNRDRNSQLEKDINSLNSSIVVSIFPAFSEDPVGDWREYGFCVACSEEIDEVLIGLGRKYEQGAIYKYTINSSGRLVQSVVSCFEEMKSTESDVIMQVIIDTKAN
ncbi:hypothetical protein RCL1_001424 [Eukaryota sp. TZLM3-RCL]